MADSVSDVFSGTVSTRLQWSRTDRQEVGSVANSANILTTYSLADGSGVGAADVVWCDTRTIPAQSFDSIDLLSLTQSTVGVSVPCVLRQLRVVRVRNNATAAGDEILVGCNAAGTLYSFKVGPGSEVLATNAVDSWAVGAGNATLRIGNLNQSAVSYSIFLIGTSVAAA